VGPGGLEPPTSSLSAKRSNQAELWALISCDFFLNLPISRHELRGYLKAGIRPK